MHAERIIPIIRNTAAFLAGVTFSGQGAIPYRR
ncbi:hypothetical protein predicted by Glimmer/Critica [Acetobacter senegalensis]|uniref:Uncharacterized protein n=1 Tax=Acetobacter senegalensis TaxID=446692 RepID=A0A0U5EWE6_9PROT|nr:hypothetical protein predicted by Glimmer/Critica [Acetobacter senegalensis]